MKEEKRKFTNGSIGTVRMHIQDTSRTLFSYTTTIIIPPIFPKFDTKHLHHYLSTLELDPKTKLIEFDLVRKARANIVL